MCGKGPLNLSVYLMALFMRSLLSVYFFQGGGLAITYGTVYHIYWLFTCWTAPGGDCVPFGNVFVVVILGACAGFVGMYLFSHIYNAYFFNALLCH